jgi:hypothetical protein
MAMAATRADALLGAVAGWLLAVDFTLLLTGGHVLLSALDQVVPTGVLVGALSLLSLVAGVVASQLAIPLGFGRRAGGVAAVAAAIGALVALVLVSTAA